MNDETTPAVFLIDDRASLISSTAGAAALWNRLVDAMRALLSELRDPGELHVASCAGYSLHLAPLDRSLYAVIVVPHGARDPIERLARRCGLTRREEAVLRALAAGNTTAEISDHLSIAPSTVAMHVKRILAKTQTPTRAAIVGRVLDEAMRLTTIPI